MNGESGKGMRGSEDMLVGLCLCLCLCLCLGRYLGMGRSMGGCIVVVVDPCTG